MSQTEHFDITTVREQNSIEGKITALSHVHSGGDEEAGNKSLLRKTREHNPETGDLYDLYYVHGNGIKGRLRRLLIVDFLRRIDYQPTDERVFASLISGGILQKSGKPQIDKSLRWEVRENIRPIDLLGTAYENQMFPANVDVWDMVPCAQETSWHDGIESDKRLSSFITESFNTRKDTDADDEGFDLDFTVDEESEQASQMKYEYDAFIPGTEFQHGFVLHPTADDLTEATLHHAIELWAQDATVGGMRTRGLGRIEHDYDAEIDGSAYRDHVEDNAQEIRDTLDELSR